MLPALILAIFLTCGQCERNYLVEVKDKPADNFGNKITEDEVIIDERRPAGYMENKITEDEVLYGDELDHHKSKKTKPLIDELDHHHENKKTKPLDHHHKNKASTDKKLKKRKQKKGRNGEDYTVEKFKQGVELAKEGLALGKKALGFVQGLGRR